MKIAVGGDPNAFEMKKILIDEGRTPSIDRKADSSYKLKQ